MKRVIFVCAAMATLLATSTNAFAQGASKVAVVATSGSSVGVLFDAGDRVALRPEISFNRSTTESSGLSTTTENTSWSLGGSVSALFFMGGSDNLRPYFSPRLGVTRFKSSSQSDGSNAYTAAGSVGAQYALGSRLCVFGEAGVSYGYQKTTVTSSLGSLTATSTSKSFGTRSQVGVGIYF